MKDKYYLIKILTNAQGQDGSSIAVYTDENKEKALEKVQVAYHNTLAAFHNAPDVLYAIVKIEEGEFGNLVAREIVDHRPEQEEVESEE